MIFLKYGFPDFGISWLPKAARTHRKELVEHVDVVELETKESVPGVRKEMWGIEI